MIDLLQYCYTLHVFSSLTNNPKPKWFNQWKGVPEFVFPTLLHPFFQPIFPAYIQSISHMVCQWECKRKMKYTNLKNALILVKWPIKRKSRFIDSHDRSPYSSYPKPIDYSPINYLKIRYLFRKSFSHFFLTLFKNFTFVWSIESLTKFWYFIFGYLSLFPTTRGWLLYSRIYRDTPDMPATPYILWYDINKICLWDKVLMNHARNFWLSIVRR